MQRLYMLLAYIEYLFTVFVQAWSIFGLLPKWMPNVVTSNTIDPAL